MTENNKEKIQAMRAGGKILGDALSSIIKSIRSGMSEIEVDKMAEDFILKRGGEPGFKKVEGYKNTICISLNNVVVHGIPTERKINEGDIVGIDCGVFYEGYHTDMSETVMVLNGKGQVFQKRTEVKNDTDKFIITGKVALFEGIKQARVGNRVGNISSKIQGIVEGEGYSIVRSLVGHGVGKNLHEEPEVPGYLKGKIESTPELTEGMTIAIEVIYNMGKNGVSYAGEDDWTIVTSDGSNSGLFERTVLIQNGQPEILTKFDGDDFGY